MKNAEITGYDATSHYGSLTGITFAEVQLSSPGAKFSSLAIAISFTLKSSRSHNHRDDNQVRYKCLPGHQLASGKVSSLFCSNGRFVMIVRIIIIMKFTMVRNILFFNNAAHHQ